MALTRSKKLTIPFPNSGWDLAIIHIEGTQHVTYALHWNVKAEATHEKEGEISDLKELLNAP